MKLPISPTLNPASTNAMGVIQKLLHKNGGSPYNRVDGLLVPVFVRQEEVDKLKELQLYPDDIWVVTYPKSGTTWMQQIVRLIRNNGVQDDTEVDRAVPWLEALPIYPHLDIEKLSRPRAFKSHMPYDLCPCGPPNTTPCKYIYITRNPKDVAVSFYFHNKRNPFHPDNDWDTFWKKFVTGEVDYGNYFDHLLSWWPHRDDENVLFIKYEDMKKDLPAAVSQVASFIGADVSSDVIAKIADVTSFDEMKSDNTANYSWTDPHTRSGSTDFLRRGIVGDWKNYLSPEQSAEIDAICAQRLDGTGLELDYGWLPCI